MSILISEALLRPVSLLRVSRKVACGLPLVLVPWEGSQRMRTLAVSSVCRTVPSESRSSLSYPVWQSGEVVIQVDISDMILPGDIECHSEHQCVYSAQCLLILGSNVHVSDPYSNTLSTVAMNRRPFCWFALYRLPHFVHAMKGLPFSSYSDLHVTLWWSRGVEE